MACDALVDVENDAWPCGHAHTESLLREFILKLPDINSCVNKRAKFDRVSFLCRKLALRWNSAR